MAFRSLAAQSDCNRHKTLQMFLSTPPIADRLRRDTRYEVEHRVGVSSGTSNVRHCSVHAITDTKLPMVYYVFEHFVASNMMWHAVISKKQRFDKESPLKRSDKESGLRAMPTLAKKMPFCQSLKYCYAHHEKVCQTHTKNDKTVVNTDTTLAQTHHCERCLQKGGLNCKKNYFHAERLGLALPHEPIGPTQNISISKFQPYMGSCTLDNLELR